MVSIDEEFQAAKAAQAAIKVLLTTTFNSTVVKTLRKANQAAILNLSSGGALNEARGNVGIALSNLALLWQIYSRRCSLQIHFRQCGQRAGGSRPKSSRIAWRTAGKVG